MPDRIQHRTITFLLLAGSIGATAAVISGSMQNLAYPDPVALGLTLDLTVVVPLAYYVLVVRPRGWSPVAVAPVVVLSIILAKALLPADHQQTLRLMQILAAPVELGLLVWIGVHATRGLSRVRQATDPLEALSETAKRLVGAGRLATMLASELAVLFFALAAWRTTPHVPPGARPYSLHRRSGHGGVVFALLLLIVVEGIPVHLLLTRWSTVLAWLITVLTVYGALWFIADYRATVLRPVLTQPNEVYLRAGLRWQCRVSRSALTEVSRKPPEAGCPTSLAFAVSPNLWLSLAAPVRLQGPYGFAREVTCLGLFVDQPAEFQRDIETSRNGNELLFPVSE